MPLSMLLLNFLFWCTALLLCLGDFRSVLVRCLCLPLPLLLQLHLCVCTPPPPIEQHPCQHSSRRCSSQILGLCCCCCKGGGLSVCSRRCWAIVRVVVLHWSDEAGPLRHGVPTCVWMRMCVFL